jgi:hypothetical protein
MRSSAGGAVAAWLGEAKKGLASLAVESKPAAVLDALHIASLCMIAEMSGSHWQAHCSK